MVCRNIYYQGAKHLLPILELLLPGIDLVRVTIFHVFNVAVHHFAVTERSSEDGTCMSAYRPSPSSCNLLQFCTTSFISEIAQYIKFGELAANVAPDMRNGPDFAKMPSVDGPSLQIGLPEGVEAGSDAHLTRAEEDAVLGDMAGTFADWVAAFLRRVILLFENLPEEGPDGSAGGATEGEC